jgi:hypothetical protein
LKRIALFFAISPLVLSAGAFAQTSQTASADDQPAAPASHSYAISAPVHVASPQPYFAPAPFSRLAFGAGISAMGINMQAAVNANRCMNLRAVGNFFNYTVNNISVSGLQMSGKLNMASAGASIDFYPFPNHGFRLSPGALFYNQNALSATVMAPGGTSFTLDGFTYYSSEANPVTGSGNLGLNTQKPAFTMTSGWGNMISRRGGHLSFPIEIGAAFIGSPSVKMALTSGQVCANPQGTEACYNVVGNAQINSNLQAQVAKYQNDLNPLRIYPIFSCGVAYNLSLRSGVSRVAAR